MFTLLLSISTVFLASTPILAESGSVSMDVHGNRWRIGFNALFTDRYMGTSRWISSMRIDNFNVNGQNAFCIEPNVEIYSTFPVEILRGQEALNAIYSAGYSAAEIDLMSKISSVGYGFAGDTSEAMNAATQVRIWQVHFNDVITNVPAEVQAKIDVINERLYRMNTQFSFENELIEFKGYGREYAVTLEDTNGVFSSYLENSIPAGIHIERNQNTLTLWADSQCAQSGQLVFDSLYSSNGTGGTPIAYVNPQNQTLASFSKTSPRQAVLNYQISIQPTTDTVSSLKQSTEKNEVTLILEKKDKDSNKPISGVEFEFYRDEINEQGYLGTVKTDKDGIARAFSVIEKTLSSNTYTETYVTNWQDLDQSVQNECLAQGWFASKEEAQNEADRKAQDELNQLIENFKKESHQFIAKEIKTKQNYYLDTSKTTSIVKKDGEGVVNFSIVNEAIKGKIKIEKTGDKLIGSETKEVDGLTKTEFIYDQSNLEDSTFEIIANEDILDPADGKVLIKKGEVVDTVTTNKEGRAETKALYLGSYIVKEIKASEGFVLNTKQVEVTLEAKNSDELVVYNEVTFTNPRQKVSLKLNKVSSTTKQNLENAIYGLYAAQDIENHDGVLIEKGALIETAISNSEGKIEFLADLPLSTYELKEIQPCEGYLLNEESIEIDATYQGMDVEEIVIEKTLENEFDRISLQIKKIDSKNNELIKNKNFEFGIYRDPDCKELIEKKESDQENGIVVFDNLDVGHYYVRETKAPAGYELSKEVVDFEIQEYGKVLINGNQAFTDESNIYVIDYENDKTDKVVTSSKNNRMIFLTLFIASGLLITIMKIVKKYEV